MRNRVIRKFVVLSVVVVSLTAFGQVAYAGEWAPGLNDHIPSKEVAQSACVFNGHDDDDLGDDALWAQTPSGGVVQSGGQLIAAGFADPGVQGVACNPTK
jgi:hypothetical protein